MGTTITGLNYGLDGETVKFYGVKGFKQDDSSWAIAYLGGDKLFQTSPESVIPDIRKCIEGDIEAGVDGKIAMLQVMPSQAVIMFLEGLILKEHFNTTTEGDGYIDIPNVELEGRKLTVRIVPSHKYIVATLDAGGVML